MQDIFANIFWVCATIVCLCITLGSVVALVTFTIKEIRGLKSKKSNFHIQNN